MDDKVVAYRPLACPRESSGAQGELSLAIVWTVREQGITRVEFFLDRSKALEAVGRSE